MLVRLALFILCSLILAPAVMAQEAKEKDYKQLGKAYDLYKEKNFKESADILDDLLNRQILEAVTIQFMCHVLYELGDLDKARKVLVDSISHGKVGVDVLGLVAKIDQRKGRFGALVNGVRMLTVLEPD